MAVMKSNDGAELAVDCYCGCNSGIRFRICKEDPDYYCFMSYTNGKFYEEQSKTFLGIWRIKLKKIWAILFNKDYYYSELVMEKAEFDIFKEYINSV